MIIITLSELYKQTIVFINTIKYLNQVCRCWLIYFDSCFLNVARIQNLFSINILSKDTNKFVWRHGFSFKNDKKQTHFQEQNNQECASCITYHNLCFATEIVLEKKQYHHKKQAYITFVKCTNICTCTNEVSLCSYPNLSINHQINNTYFMICFQAQLTYKRKSPRRQLQQNVQHSEKNSYPFEQCGYMYN